jgi:trimethylamine:corrinoid methyltransferase-like protein
VVKANQRFKEILKSCPDSLIDPALDNDLKTYMKRVL